MNVWFYAAVSSKVEKQSNFMGDTFVIHTKSGRWICKGVTENVDLRQWVLQKARNVSSTSSRSLQTDRVSSPPASESASTTSTDWAASSYSSAKSEESKDDFFAKAESTESLSSWSESSQPTDVYTEKEDLNEELQSVFDHVNTSSTQSVKPPVERNAEVDALLEKLASSTDEESGSGAGCGGNLVKFIIFIWIFGIFSDLCN